MTKCYVCSPLGAETNEKIEVNRLAVINYCKLVEKDLGYNAKAPHSYLPLILNDNIPEERQLALSFGLDLLKLCDCIAVCGDRISKGMYGEIRTAIELKKPIFCFNDMVEYLIKDIGGSPILMDNKLLGQCSQFIGTLTI